MADENLYDEAEGSCGTETHKDGECLPGRAGLYRWILEEGMPHVEVQDLPWIAWGAYRALRSHTYRTLRSFTSNR